MRAAAPPLGSPGRPVRRLAVPGPDPGLGWARGRGRRGGPHVGSPPRVYAEGPGTWPPCARVFREAPALSAPKSTRAPTPACAPPVRAADGGVLPREVPPAGPTRGHEPDSDAAGPGQVERRPGGQGRKLWIAFRPWERDLLLITVPPRGLSAC